MSLRELEKILYFEEYVVIDPGTVPGIKKKSLLSVDRVRKLREEHGQDAFNPGMGAEAIRELLRGMDLEALALLLQVGRVVALVRVGAAAVEFASRSWRHSSSPATSRSG